jgi:hypothetical protein
MKTETIKGRRTLSEIKKIRIRIKNKTYDQKV